MSRRSEGRSALPRTTPGVGEEVPGAESQTKGLHADPLLANVPDFDGFKILDSCIIYVRVGRGGMGAVYRGRHLKLDIDVAIKCLLPGLAAAGEDMVQRFQREGRLAARLNHPNVVRVFDVDCQHGIHYLVMEYVEGETARERVKRKGHALSPGEAVTLVLEAARGLAAAHSQGIVHRDIKPDNILISMAGEVKLADLGLGCVRQGAARGDTVTAAGVALGTPGYMPPEQWDSLSRVGPEGDVWALGSTLYFLLCARDAYCGLEMTEIMRRVCLEPFPDIAEKLPDLPEEVAAVVRKCTEREPENRYASAGELVEALEELVSRLGLHGRLEDSDTGAGTTRCKLVSPPPPEVLARARQQLETGRGSGQTRTPNPYAATLGTPTSRSLATVRKPRRRARVAAALFLLCLLAALGALLRWGPLHLGSGVAWGSKAERSQAAPAAGRSAPGQRPQRAASMEPASEPEPAPRKEPAPGKGPGKGEKASGSHSPRASVSPPAPAPAPPAVAPPTSAPAEAARAPPSPPPAESRKVEPPAPPLLTLEGPADGAWVRPPCLFEGKVEARGSVQVRVGGVTAELAGDRWRASLPLPPGEQEVLIEARTPEGGTAGLRRRVRVDGRKPALEVLEPPAETPHWTRGGSLRVRVRVVEDGELAGVYVSGEPAEPAGSGIFVHEVALSEGKRSIEVTAEDRAGNRARDAVEVICDRAAPRLTVTEPEGEVLPGRLRFRGAVEDASPCLVTLNGKPAKVGEDGGWEIELDVAAGTATLKAEARDKAGNEAVPLVKGVKAPPPPPPAPVQREVPGFSFLRKNERRCFEYRHQATGLVLVLLPGGTYRRGSSPEERQRVARAIDASVPDEKSRTLLKAVVEAEGPRREVTLDPFLIAKHEVSQEVWAKVMGVNPSRFKGKSLPVENVSWSDAKEFCRRTGLALPTEAQWEYACRGGTDTPFAFGEAIDSAQVNSSGGRPFSGGPTGLYRGSTMPVDSLGPNGFGLHHVHGNVAEWCEDGYQDGYYARPESTARNPLCSPAARGQRSSRGGSWAVSDWYCRSASREGALDRPHPHRGFRPAFHPLP